MKRLAMCVISLLVLLSVFSWAGDTIPKAAWKRPIGLPLANAGGKKPTLDAGHIDDGYWQGLQWAGWGQVHSR